MWRAVVVVGAGVMLCGCVSSPKETVLNLDSNDPRWKSRSCVEARRAVFTYDDQKAPRQVVRTAGNLAFPVAGTAAALVMSRFRDDERELLNARVNTACVTPPKVRSTKAAPAKGKKAAPARKPPANVARR